MSIEKQLKNASMDLEKINQEIEEGDKGEEKFEEALILEKELENLEKKLGVDDKEIVKIYENLSESSIIEALSDASVREAVDSLRRGESVDKNNISGSKLVLIAACFLFILLKSFFTPSLNKAHALENSGFNQRIEKMEVNRFLSNVKVNKIFFRQEYLEMIIPPKPIVLDDETWEIVIYNKKDFKEGSFEVSDKPFVATFGRDKKIEIGKIKLQIIKGEETEQYEIIVHKEGKFEKNKKKYENEVDSDYQKLLQTIDIKSSYFDKFEEIKNILESENNSDIIKDKIQEYLVELAHEYVYRLLEEKDIDVARKKNNIITEIFFLPYPVPMNDQTVMSLCDLEALFSKVNYKKSTSNLSIPEKIKFLSEHSLLDFDYRDDKELLDALDKKIKELNKFNDKERIKKGLEELSSIFDGNTYFKHIPSLAPLKENYDSVKKIIAE